MVNMLAAAKQLYEWFSLSFCHTSSTSDVYAKVQGQKSKVKVTEVTTQFSRFWTVTPV